MLIPDELGVFSIAAGDPEFNFFLHELAIIFFDHEKNGADPGKPDVYTRATDMFRRYLGATRDPERTARLLAAFLTWSRGEEWQNAISTRGRSLAFDAWMLQTSRHTNVFHIPLQEFLARTSP